MRISFRCFWISLRRLYKSFVDILNHLNIESNPNKINHSDNNYSWSYKMIEFKHTDYFIAWLLFRCQESFNLNLKLFPLISDEFWVFRSSHTKQSGRLRQGENTVQARIQPSWVLLLCKICTEAVPKTGQSTDKEGDIGRNIQIRSHGFSKPVPESRARFLVWTQGFWKPVTETRVIFHIWRHGFEKNPCQENCARFHKWSHGMCAFIYIKVRSLGCRCQN